MAKKKKNRNQKKKTTKKVVEETPVVEEVVAAEPAPAAEPAEDDAAFRPEEIHLLYEAIRFYKDYWSKSIDLNEEADGDQLEKMINIRDAYEHIEVKFLKVFATEE